MKNKLLFLALISFSVLHLAYAHADTETLVRVSNIGVNNGSPLGFEIRDSTGVVIAVHG